MPNANRFVKKINDILCGEMFEHLVSLFSSTLAVSFIIRRDQIHFEREWLKIHNKNIVKYRTNFSTKGQVDKQTFLILKHI